MKNEERPISDLLAELGLAHRPCRGVGWVNSREVYDVATGEIVGRMDAAEAVEYLRSQNML